MGFTGDEGGNTVSVRWFRRRTNLHHVTLDFFFHFSSNIHCDNDWMMLKMGMGGDDDRMKITVLMMMMMMMMIIEGIWWY